MDAMSSGGWNRTSTLPASAGRSTLELHRNERRGRGARGEKPLDFVRGLRTTVACNSLLLASRPSFLVPRLWVAGGSRTHTNPVHSRAPLPLWVRPQYPRQESNLQLPPSQGGVLP